MSLSCLICFAPVTEEFTTCHDCTQWIAELASSRGIDISQGVGFAAQVMRDIS